MQKLRDSRDAMIDIMNRFPEEEAALREMERVFHSHVDKKEQPDEAFYINAASMMKTLKKAVSGTVSETFSADCGSGSELGYRQ